MKKFLLAPALAVLLLGAASSLLAQSPVEFSSKVNGATAVSIGERVVVTYSAKLPAGATLALDSLVTPAPEEGARPPGGAVLEFEPPPAPTLTKSKTGDFFEWRQDVALFPFMAGTVQVPGPHYSFKESSSSSSGADVRPPAVELTVASRLPKDKKPEEITPKADKGIRIPAIPAKVWAALGAVVALVAGLAWWWVLRRRRQGDLGEPAAPRVPPGEELRRELDRLAPAVDTLGGDARGFYSELTHAVKRYLERTTGDPVLEWTTFETIRRFREKGFDLPADVALPDLLASADRVKFGKGAATRDDAREGLARARRLHDHVEAREAARRAAEAAAASAKAKAS
ncbi:MAG: hypothetical protein IPL89_03705 [Acidobacteria bacterium]|nr:hypothetical protein [Acidobacteriota bacterium]